MTPLPANSSARELRWRSRYAKDFRTTIRRNGKSQRTRQRSDFVQSTFDALPTIFAGIAGGSITSLAEIDQRLASL
jgi:hypothetical protein